jgi:hypothetical protein
LKECFNTNYFGCIWAYQAAAPLLKRYKGHFVCITSIAAEMSTPGMSMLSAATHAIHGFMDGAIKENPGFDITLVCSPPVHSGQGQAAPSDDSKISSLPLNQALNFLLEAVEKKKKKAFLGAMGIFSDSPSLLMQAASHKDGMTKARNMRRCPSSFVTPPPSSSSPSFAHHNAISFSLQGSAMSRDESQRNVSTRKFMSLLSRHRMMTMPFAPSLFFFNSRELYTNYLMHNSRFSMLTELHSDTFMKRLVLEPHRC